MGSSVVVGPYVNFEKSSVENCAGTDCLKVKDNFAAGLHLGYAINDKSMIYGKLGYAKIRLNVTDGFVSYTESGDGFQGAIGYEHSFSKNFYGRLELGYGDNGEILGLNVQRRHAGVGLGVRF